MLWLALVLLTSTLVLRSVTPAGPFGLAITPPMGWRSWNSMGKKVTQAKMEDAMEALSEKRAGGQSLADLGYVTAGLDDAWQACGTGIDGSFHDAQGKPLVNKTTFPDIGAMVAKAHSLGLQAGFYINNCICGENQWRGNTTFEQVVYEGTVKTIVGWGFDGVKIDSCSEFTNMSKWAGLFAATGKPMVLENCHNSDGQDPCPEAKACPSTGVCPYNLWRLGRDIGADWQSVYSNLQDTVPWNQGTPSLSRPGRWGYPDMMQVGQLSTFEEDRAHFFAWCIVSSPLTLGYDLTDDNITERVWPIVSNKKAIAINQAWAGSPGYLVDEFVSPYVNKSFLTRHCGDGTALACCTHYDGPPGSPSHYDGTGVPPLCGTQLWAKPLSKSNGSVAVLLLNNQDLDVENVSSTVYLEMVLPPAFNGSTVSVYDVWTNSVVHRDAIGRFQTDSFGGHDSRFYIITPTNRPVHTQRNVHGQIATAGSAVVTSCEERCAGRVETNGGNRRHRQPAFMHCCVGVNSSGQTPSCVMGCLLGKHTTKLAECRANCDRAHGKCSWSSPATGGATLNLCASCASGVAGDCKSRFASGMWNNFNASSCLKSFNRGACNITDSTCSVQTVEDWAPVRGCEIGDCYQGCAWQLGCTM